MFNRITYFVIFLAIIAMTATFAQHSDITRGELLEEIKLKFQESKILFIVFYVFLVPLSYIGYSIPYAYFWIIIMWVIMGLSLLRPLSELLALFIAITYLLFKFLKVKKNEVITIRRT